MTAFSWHKKESQKRSFKERQDYLSNGRYGWKSNESYKGVLVGFPKKF